MLFSFFFQLLRFPPGEALIILLDVSAEVLLLTPTTDTTLHKVRMIHVFAFLQQPHINPFFGAYFNEMNSLVCIF